MFRHSAKFARALAASALLWSVGFALAEEKGAAFNADNARAAMTAMDKDEALQARARACPADVFRKEATLGGLLLGDEAVTREHCAAHPEECYRTCVSKRSGEHCFRLALAFQENESVVAPRYAQLMFSMACALGKASGCTNRGAHMRNAAEEGDPLDTLSQDEKDLCQFRSFKIACKNSDNWGCAMLGQAYRNGEGARKSASKARGFYKKSCRLDPDFAACEFSRGALASMRRARR
jgi:TPR repeat protein